MTAFIVNPAGFVHSVTDEHAETLLAGDDVNVSGYRLADEDEIRNWYLVQGLDPDNVPEVEPPAPFDDGLGHAREAAAGGTEASAPVDVSEVPDGKVDDVVDWVGDDPGRAAAALSVESSRAKPRTSLVEALSAVIEAAAGGTEG